MKLAEELVALKREMRVEHGLDEGSMSPEEEVQRQFARLKSLRSYLDLDD
ncbi:MAG: hypothetical protein NZ988_06305 [Thaumarchaeota archaeon]|nr:hypothetical protein [Candidatus Calditenuaceae archaeon]MDW8187634.1 hypothetical protein [Nitrososphaerota archaeon]